jgi:uncharacterized protein with von Willebrand factor type A (vWA) domain
MQERKERLCEGCGTGCKYLHIPTLRKYRQSGNTYIRPYLTLPSRVKSEVVILCPVQLSSHSCTIYTMVTVRDFHG